MGEIGINKALSCLICDANVQINDSYSIFYTLIASSGVSLANCIEKNLSLKDIASASLRSNFVCFKCFEYFDELSDCENRIQKLKGTVWSIYKDTCERLGVELETAGTYTQTDRFECTCKAGINKGHHEDRVDDVKVECEDSCDESGCFDETLKGGEDDECDDEAEDSKQGIEITVEADLHFEDDDSNGKWKRRPMSCKFCGKWFKTIVDLEQHVVTHEKGSQEEDSEEEREDRGEVKKRKRYSCHVCQLVFRRPFELKEHMATHGQLTPFICKHCGRRFKSKGGAAYHALKEHKIVIAKGKPADVSGLEENFYTDVQEEQMEANQESVNATTSGAGVDGDATSSDDELPLAKRKKDFIVEKKNKQVRGQESEKSRQKQALQTLKNCCDVSVTKIPKPKMMTRSPKTRKPKESKVTEEEVDDVMRSDLVDVTMDTNSKEDEEETQDDESGVVAEDVSEKPAKTKRRYPLTALLKMKRPPKDSLPAVREPKFKCDICGKLWKTRGELNAHRVTHSDARPYICEICGQAYKHKPALDVHVGMHRGIFHNQCPYCQKAFTQKGALQRHLPIHTGDLPYQCELCGKRFVHRTSFSIHTMAHTGVRNIRCKVCNLGVLSKSHLRRHMRIHTGEKPYDCQTCGKAFAERYNLVAHQRIHDPSLVGPARQQKKRGQTCRLCNATFDRRHKLEEHMVAHHKVVEETPRNSLLDSGAEAYYGAAPVRSGKPMQRDEVEERTSPGNENPNDLTVRTLQNLQGLRSLELLRNLESSQRNLELIRIANGMGSVDNAGGAPWAAYVNPGP